MISAIDIIACGPHQDVHLYSQGQLVVKEHYHSTRQFMENLCVQNGTTLEGCYEASRVLLENAYKRPIYIGGRCNQIFIPTSSIKNRHCVWVSLDYLMNDTVSDFNDYGYEIMSIKRWQKHLSDGIALKLAIFKKET